MPALLETLGFDVTVVDKVLAAQRAVSSTAIREAVELGDLAGAAEMLGRDPSVLGVVVHGDALGRQLGFPTANLDLQHELHPPPGVYYGWAGVYEGGKVEQCCGAVANIGFRPRPRRALRPAAHRVSTCSTSRATSTARRSSSCSRALAGRAAFPDLEALKAQIRRDLAVAREKLDQAARR
jgi:riboflavin kinase/FMN adenylyltransferase